MKLQSVLQYTWIPLTVYVIIYAILAAQYFVPFVFPSISSHWYHFLFGTLVSQELSMGNGSVHEYFINNIFRESPASKYYLLMHSFCGGAALSLMSLQFIPYLRKNYLNFHRFIGNMALTFTFLKLVGSAAHLLFIPNVMKTGAFSGTAFLLVLWTLWATTMVSALGSMEKRGKRGEERKREKERRRKERERRGRTIFYVRRRLQALLISNY